MAGVPPRVVQRAEALLDNDGAADTDAPASGRTHAPTASADGGELPAELLAELRAVDLADTTPLEALNLLSRLQKRVE
jgi:DNA mismatch repair protein MutS